MRASVGIGPFRFYGDSWSEKQAKRRYRREQYAAAKACEARLIAQLPARMAADTPLARKVRRMAGPLTIVAGLVFLLLSFVAAADHSTMAVPLGPLGVFMPIIGCRYYWAVRCASSD